MSPFQQLWAVGNEAVEGLICKKYEASSSQSNVTLWSFPSDSEFLNLNCVSENMFLFSINSESDPWDC